MTFILKLSLYNLKLYLYIVTIYYILYIILARGKWGGVNFKNKCRQKIQKFQK